jgi:ABC-type transport system involved in multi-copper enzyme maturation permease subunit
VSTTTHALISARQATKSVRRPRLLLRVMIWEQRRFRASRLFWLQALGFFCLLLFVAWAQRVPDQYYFGPNLNGFVAGTSAWGMMETLPPASLLLLGLLVPFVTADGVTRDLSRRTHELLMTTALPSQAYVWGRYLMSLLMSLGLAVLLLVAYLGMGQLMHLAVSDYPAPDIGTVLILWVGMVVSATVLLSSVSFALSTLFPRQSTLVKLVIMTVWFVGAVILPAGLGNKTDPPAWYSAWDPTSAATADRVLFHYSPHFTQGHVVTVTSEAQLQHVLLTLENQLPDLGSWFAPHLIEAGVSLLLVALAAFGFQRFRNAFGG